MKKNERFQDEMEQEFSLSISCPVVHVSLADYIDMPSATEFNAPLDNACINAVAAAVLYAQSRPVINLCMGIYSRDAFLHKYRKHVSVCAMFFLFAAVFLFLNVLSDIVLLEKQVDALNMATTEIYTRTFPGDSAIVDPLMQMKINFREAGKRFSSRPDSAGRPAASAPPGH